MIKVHILKDGLEVDTISTHAYVTAVTHINCKSGQKVTKSACNAAIINPPDI
jgi:hypothetical protein